jgi:RNA polymerase sigma-70 factor, ECF subfamily
LFRASSKGVIGRYQLEAAIQSAHVVPRINGQSDWAAIERLYDALAALTDSPVVVINRAIAIAETRDASVGLTAPEALAGGAQLDEYRPYWAARADLLWRTGCPMKPSARSVWNSTRRCGASCSTVAMEVHSKAAATIRTN